MSYEVGKYYKFREGVLGYPGIVRVVSVDGDSARCVFVVPSQFKAAGEYGTLNAYRRGNTTEVTPGELGLWRLTGNS